MAYNKLQQLQDNIEAIRTAFKLKAEGRGAQNEEERQSLRKYAGFGALKCILNEETDIAKWPKSEQPLFEPTMQLRQIVHDYSKNDREFDDYMKSLKSSVLTAFYTDTHITDALSDALKDSGVKIERFLEPSAGQGAFVDSFLHFNPGAECMAFEKDLITGLILGALHPSITTEVKGFETIDPDFNEYFDVVASNVPFGDFAVADPKYATSKDIAYRQSTKAIHNYFFLKSLEQTRDGGIVAFIAPRGVMNGASPFVRMQMVKQSDLVGAVRLPNNTFTENAGTEVGSDLIILQKHTGKKRLSQDEELFIQSVVDRQTKVPDNRYFQTYPQNIICTDAKIGTDPYGKPALIYTHSDGIGGIARDMREAIDVQLKQGLDLERYKSRGLTPNAPEPKQEKPKQQNSPLMNQWSEMKKKHPDAILLFRVGDFYETFNEDAVAASEILGITLTRRSQGNGKSMELAGFPHHALDTYLPKLVRAGKRVAICEQLEQPKKKVLKKAVTTEKVTPGKKIETPKPELKPDAPKTKEEQKPIGQPRKDYTGQPITMKNLYGETVEIPGARKLVGSSFTPGEHLAYKEYEVVLKEILPNGNLNLERPNASGINQSLIDVSPDQVRRPGSEQSVDYWYKIHRDRMLSQGFNKNEAAKLDDKIMDMIEKSKKEMERKPSFANAEKLAQALAMFRVIDETLQGKIANEKADEIKREEPVVEESKVTERKENELKRESAPEEKAEIEKPDLGNFEPLFERLEEYLHELIDSPAEEDARMKFSAVLSTVANHIYFEDEKGNNMPVYVPYDTEMHARTLDALRQKYNIEETDRYKAGSDLIVEYSASVLLRKQEIANPIEAKVSNVDNVEITTIATDKPKVEKPRTSLFAEEDFNQTIVVP